MFLEALLLLLVANGAPVLAYDLLKQRWAWPVDGGRRLADGLRVLGDSCTWRGWIVSLSATACCAWALGLGWGPGLLTATAAMAGDAFSSFVKRRRGLAPGDRVLGLDQIPESLLPLVVLHPWLALGWLEVMLELAAFMALELAISRVAYRLGLRKHPY